MGRKLLLMRSSFLLAVLACTPLITQGSDKVEFFETRIRPVLIKHCYECHSGGAAELQADLQLDYRDGLLKGGASGPAIVPGEPAESLLLSALRHESFEMPPDGKLSDRIVADFAQWIADGAMDPRDHPRSMDEVAAIAWQAQLEERRDWWSLQPLRGGSLPQVADPSWPAESLDRFILHAQEQVGLSPAPSADAETLLRRLCFVLTGLPPQPAEVARFKADYAEDQNRAFATQVDLLLASPQFGERFARHWMDVVRYTDTYGYEWDNPAKGSWEYRDYLIRAFNHDVGFDQLIREQLAGDLLEAPRIDPALEVNESLIGPMFYHLGEHRHGSSLDFNGIHQDMVNNKIDAFSKAFLAMTVACARCHDHKLDAVSQVDYYALAGVFMSPRWTSRVVDTADRHAEPIRELKRLRGELAQELAQVWLKDRTDLPERLRQWAQQNDQQPTDQESIDYVIWRLAQSPAEGIAPLWNDLRDNWKAISAQRTASNETTFSRLTDFASPELPDGWTSDGAGISAGFVNNGAPRVSLAEESWIEELLPRGYHTHALSTKLPGAIRLPAQTDLAGKHVSLQVRGGDWAGTLVVPQNAFQSEQVSFLDPARKQLHWITLSDRGLSNGVTRVFAELTTASLNPNFPPRTGLGRAANVTLPSEDEDWKRRSWFSLTGIVTHDAGGTPQDPRLEFQSLYQDTAAPTTKESVWQRLEVWFSSALHRWADGAASREDVKLVNWLLQRQLLTNSGSPHHPVTQLVQRYRHVEDTIEFSRTVNSMDERSVTPVNYRLNIRGNVDDDGPTVSRDFLGVFAGQHDVATSKGSGRLELAAYLSSSRHPQTARVYVNRVWQWIFGTGIVATSNDFGKLGDPPSHPELLDWLAVEFMREGWSTKQLVRRLVMSQTFRQGGAVSESGRRTDPQNRRLHHYPTRRLEAEAIRDTLLAVSNRLDPQLFGPPLNPPRTVEDGAKRLFSGPLDSEGRRSIYLEMSIMDPPKLLVCFNLPDLRLPTGRRDVTNVPAQSLALLNHPLVLQLAEHWASELLHDRSPSVQARVKHMFEKALGRAPDEKELLRWTDAVESFSTTDDILHDQPAWTELAHTFFNLKEFIYYR